MNNRQRAEGVLGGITAKDSSQIDAADLAELEMVATQYPDLLLAAAKSDIDFFIYILETKKTHPLLQVIDNHAANIADDYFNVLEQFYSTHNPMVMPDLQFQNINTLITSVNELSSRIENNSDKYESLLYKYYVTAWSDSRRALEFLLSPMIRHYEPFQVIDILILHIGDPQMKNEIQSPSLARVVRYIAKDPISLYKMISVPELRAVLRDEDFLNIAQYEINSCIIILRDPIFSAKLSNIQLADLAKRYDERVFGEITKNRLLFSKLSVKDVAEIVTNVHKLKMLMDNHPKYFEGITDAASLLNQFARTDPFMFVAVIESKKGFFISYLSLDTIKHAVTQSKQALVKAINTPEIFIKIKNDYNNIVQSHLKSMEDKLSNGGLLGKSDWLIIQTCYNNKIDMNKYPLLIHQFKQTQSSIQSAVSQAVPPNIITTRTASIKRLPFIHSKIELTHINHINGKLFEQSEIDLPRPNLDSLPQGQKRLSKMASKLPFTAIRFNDDGDVYAVYLGKKHKDKPGSERTKALGAGAFGTVKLAQNQRTGDLLALKVQTVYDNDPVRAKKKLDAIKEEYNKLKRLGLAEGMVEHKGIDIDGNAWTKISIGMTLIRGMDVSDFIEDKNRELSQTRWLEIATNTINALAKFDIDGPYIHRDVKPPNFMINPDTGEVIVVDVGLAKAKAPDGLVEGGAGTPDYIAPEMFTGMPVDFKADIYSLGKTLAEMLNLAYHDPIVSDLYDKTKDIRVLHNYIRVREPNDPTFQDPSQLRITDKDIRDQVIAMLKKMTDLNPCNRPNFTEVSQFFSEMKLEVLNATDKLRKVAVFDAAEYLSYKEGSRGRAAMIEALKAADEVTLLDTQLNRSDYNYMALQKELEQQGIHLGSQLLTATDNKSTAVDVLSDAVNQIERQQPNEVRNYVYVTTKKMTSKMVEKLHANDINYMTAISTKNSKDYRDEILLFARNQTLSMSKFVSVIKPTLDDEINRLSGKNSNRAKQRKAIIEKYLDEFLKTNPNKPFNMDYMLAKLNQLQSEIREHRKVFASKTEKLITQTIKKATVQPIVNQATASISGMFAPKQPLTDMPLNSAKVTNAPTKKKSSSS